MKIDVECAICQRITPPNFQEKHHLIPKSRKGTETILVCCNCGDQVHKLFTLKEMELKYNTLETLLSHPDIQKWIRWVKKRSSFTFSMKSKKQR